MITLASSVLGFPIQSKSPSLYSYVCSCRERAGTLRTASQSPRQESLSLRLLCRRSWRIAHSIPITGECVAVVGPGDTFGALGSSGVSMVAREELPLVAVNRDALLEAIGSDPACVSLREPPAGEPKLHSLNPSCSALATGRQKKLLLLGAAVCSCGTSMLKRANSLDQQVMES